MDRDQGGTGDHAVTIQWGKLLRFFIGLYLLALLLSYLPVIFITLVFIGCLAFTIYTIIRFALSMRTDDDPSQEERSSFPLAPAIEGPSFSPFVTLRKWVDERAKIAATHMNEKKVLGERVFWTGYHAAMSEVEEKLHGDE